MITQALQRAANACQQSLGRWRLLPRLAPLAGVLAMLGLDLSLQAATPVYGWNNITVKAPFAGRDGAGLLTYQNKLWLLGGWNPSTAVFPKTTTNEVWSSSDGKQWTQVKPNTFGTSAFNPASDWEGRHMAGWAVFQNKLWIIGGDSNQCHYQPNVWNSSDGVHWTQVASNVPWGNRVLFYTVVFNNRLWVMGGQTLVLDTCQGGSQGPDTFYNDVWSSSDGANWTQVRPSSGEGSGAIWDPRGVISGAVVFNGRMWVIGGGTYASPQVLYNDVWSSADGFSWTRVTANAPWNPRIYHSITTYDGRMWVIGGHGPNGDGNLADVWYSSDGVQWTQIPNTPWEARHALSVAALNGALWLTGGTTDHDGSRNDVWRLENNGALVPIIGSQLLQ